jgi:hypothetical protein
LLEGTFASRRRCAVDFLVVANERHNEADFGADAGDHDLILHIRQKIAEFATRIGVFRFLQDLGKFDADMGQPIAAHRR